MRDNNIIFHSDSDKEINEWRDSHGNTKLHIASWEGNLEEVKFLIPKVDITIKNNNGNTALHFAASIPKNSQVIAELAKAGGIDIKSNAGFAALHYAAGTGQTGNVKALLEFGADFNIRDKDGRTAIHIAAKEGKTEAVEALLKKAESELVDNTQGKYSELVDNTQGKYTALHLAAEYGHYKVVAKLIEFRADFNATDNCGLTALHIAVTKGNIQVVTALMNANARVDIKNNEGDTALHIAVTKGNIQVVTDLLNAGANVDIKNKKDETALDIANKIEDESNRNKIIDLLNTGRANSNERIAVGALLINKPHTISEKRPDKPGKEGPLYKKFKVDRAGQLDGAGGAGTTSLG